MFVVNHLTFLGVCGSHKVRIFLNKALKNCLFFNKDASLLSFLIIHVSVLLNSPLLLILMNMCACYNGARIL